MKIMSVALSSNALDSVEVEIAFLPGLPGLNIFGDVETKVRQSAPKIKSAILQQGFNWPRTRQMVVWVRSAKGAVGCECELAIAVAILIQSGQLKIDSARAAAPWIGELTLDGRVVLPAGVLESHFAHKQHLWISPFREGRVLIRALTDLKGLEQGSSHVIYGGKGASEVDDPFRNYQAPQLSAQILVSDEAARVLMVAAAGEHHLLMAGPPGTGKTTMAQVLHSLLALPQPNIWEQSQDIWSSQRDSLSSRPFVAPHHSATPLSVVGGGQPPQFGEISRAHGGVLFLDEYLQFDTRIQEALREPLERGQVRLARGPHVQIFPAQFLLVAATNLCPCGRWTPKIGRVCAYSSQRCLKIISRLSGPMLDRFTLVAFSDEWSQDRKHSLKQLQARISAATQFRIQRQQGLPNQLVEIGALEKRVSKLAERLLPGWNLSERRRQALVRVAGTLADFDLQFEIGPEHLSQAIELVLAPLCQIEKIA